MDLIDQLRIECGKSIITLRRRHANTSDAAEKKALVAVIADLNDRIAQLNQATLLHAASLLADITAALEKAVASARRGPFDGYLSALEEHWKNLDVISGAMHGREALESAAVEPATVEPATVEPATVEPATTGAAQSPAKAKNAAATVLVSKVFEDLEDEYQHHFDTCVVRPAAQANLDYYLVRLGKGRDVYKDIEKTIGTPWQFVGVIHALECGFNFSCHMHNGDPLTAHTVRVPAGCPKLGKAPFTWRESTIDAFTLKGFHDISDWSIPRMLYQLEKYNGFGYRNRGLPTPYLWSFSNHYSKGKYVADGKFDPQAVSKQCGAALMLKALM